MGANIRKGTYLFDMFGVVGFAFWRLQTVLFQFDDRFMADLVPVSTEGFPSPLFCLFSFFLLQCGTSVMFLFFVLVPSPFEVLSDVESAVCF